MSQKIKVFAYREPVNSLLYPRSETRTNIAYVIIHRIIAENYERNKFVKKSTLFKRHTRQ